MRKAVCVGINDYPGSANDLSGCVNDANNWRAFLSNIGFDVEIVLNSAATKSRVLALLQQLAQESMPEDVLVFTYSGHGTQVRDTSGDEEDGYDEALYLYDGAIIDDEIRSVLSAMNSESVFVVIMDSCFSGTVTRAFLAEGKPRFVTTEAMPLLKRNSKIFSEEDMKEVLLTGCSDTEYSYDAKIDGVYCGAFSHFALEALKDTLEKNYSEYYSDIRKYLPSSQYPQTPQLEANAENKMLEIFSERTDEEPQPDPEPFNLIQFILDLIKWILSLIFK